MHEFGPLKLDDDDDNCQRFRARAAATPSAGSTRQLIFNPGSDQTKTNFEWSVVRKLNSAPASGSPGAPAQGLGYGVGTG